MTNVVQEALLNVYKHAHAKNSWVFIEREGDELKIIINDDGQGFQTGELLSHGDVPHFGLDIMHERAEEIGGRLAITSSESEGTSVQLILPLGSLVSTSLKVPSG
jgi:signal transduction histidine kinase